MKALDLPGFSRLLETLKEQGYTLLGPRVKDASVVYDELQAASDLPVGWTDKQEAGHYRLEHRNDDAYFGYTSSPQSWKRFLHPPVLRLFTAKKTGQGFEVIEDKSQPPKYAFIGVRACELEAILIQDKVFLDGQHRDATYASRREGVFIVAVNCTRAGSTCFCTSMETGPKAKQGFDLALTEIIDGSHHAFVVEVGSERGEELLELVPHREATPEELELAEQGIHDAAQHMGRHLNTLNLKELLYANLEHPRWNDVAERCLTCGNCTMVCPTCFCTTVEDTTDLMGKSAERTRHWDSCFTTDFSYIHGGSVRTSVRSRYRQWLTHKLASWIDQYGTSGCVGCGRCITWCPVGIDITEEVKAIRETVNGFVEQAT